MPRLVVTDENETVLLDEEVKPIHLDDPHHAEQFIERLAWAIEGSPPPRRLREPRRFPYIGLGG